MVSPLPEATLNNNFTHTRRIGNLLLLASALTAITLFGLLFIHLHAFHFDTKRIAEDSSLALLTLGLGVTGAVLWKKGNRPSLNSVHKPYIITVNPFKIKEPIGPTTLLAGAIQEEGEISRKEVLTTANQPSVITVNPFKIQEITEHNLLLECTIWEEGETAKKEVLKVDLPASLFYQDSEPSCFKKEGSRIQFTYQNEIYDVGIVQDLTKTFATEETQIKEHNEQDFNLFVHRIIPEGKKAIGLGYTESIENDKQIFSIPLAGIFEEDISIFISETIYGLVALNRKEETYYYLMIDGRFSEKTPPKEECNNGILSIEIPLF